MKNTKIKFYKIFRRMGIQRNELTLSANLYSDFKFDSNDMNILLFFMETKFDIIIEDKEIKNIQTVEKAIEFVEYKLI